MSRMHSTDLLTVNWRSTVWISKVQADYIYETRFKPIDEAIEL